ncbi:hypothetical protein AVEN_161376-1 [Araneus ventricosus]|uniref:MADF domain-containing protein n=1 Tax=Araneus ventricosus TaxID=182803 RepID=A0A4Y2TQF9_ARAVE|nr:hypothetical protein AVEN_161376-1 [Araneus ventricosus]
MKLTCSGLSVSLFSSAVFVHFQRVMSSRQFVIDVIELYKESTCLWKVSDPDYHDKNKRGRAMDQLIELFKTKDINTNKDLVQKKSAHCEAPIEKNPIR